MAEKFNLKWNDFQTNVSKSFSILRNETYLHDVTLVSNDFKHISAHKLVLSASSEFFRNVLQNTKQNQPVICLDGVGSADLDNVLDYVYNGEVRIYQEELDNFLTIAQRLKLEGLMQNVDDDDEESESKNNQYESNVKSEDFERDKKAKPVSRRNVSTSMPARQPIDGIVAENDTKMFTDDHKEVIDQNITKNEDGSKSCYFCGKTVPSSTNINNLRKHVETHLDLSYPCNSCGKKFRSKNSLNSHKSRNHNAMHV